MAIFAPDIACRAELGALYAGPPPSAQGDTGPALLELPYKFDEAVGTNRSRQERLPRGSPGIHG